MANMEHLKILKEGVETWNHWKLYNSVGQTDLTEADLHGMDLSGVLLDGANLYSANLQGANLYAAHLCLANLERANLIRANLSSADLSLSVLAQADLYMATLNGAELGGANAAEARVGWTCFGDLDLSLVRALDTVVHMAPSTIGVDTLYRSRGKIPDVFLDGCGVPDTLIAFMHSLDVESFQRSRCFISYSNNDKLFSDGLYQHLRANGIDAWYFPRSAPWGKHLWEEIGRIVKRYDKMVLVCSENSLQSEPVMKEMELALSREEREHKEILLPIRIDNYIFEQWQHPKKKTVCDKVVGDFREWDQVPGKFDADLKKLLSYIQVETETME